MEISFLLINIVIILFLIMIIYSIYASLIQKRNKVLEAFSAIDVQLKKRYDLIPNILTIAKTFMEHEKSLFEEVTKLRTQAVGLASGAKDINKKMALDVEIAKKMGQIFVAVENYPQLKSDQTMITAMQTYNEVEEHIAAARRFYNAAAFELKNAVEIFPSSFFASIMNIKAVDFFAAQDNEKEPVKASDYLKSK